MSRNRILVGICVLCICLVGLFAANRYKDVLWDYLLPGDSAVTRSALFSFADDVRSGTPVTEAITVFCREIIEGATH